MKAWSIQIWFRSQPFVFSVFFTQKSFFFQPQMKGCAHTLLLDLFLPTCLSITSCPLTASFPFLFLPHPRSSFSPGIFIFLASVSLRSPEFWLACTPTLSLGALVGFQLICGEKNCNIITIYYTCLINSMLNYGMTWTWAEDTYPRAAEGPEVWRGSPGNPACWKRYRGTICAFSSVIPMNPWIVHPPFARLHPFDPPLFCSHPLFLLCILMSWPLCWESSLHLCQVLKRRL